MKFLSLAIIAAAMMALPIAAAVCPTTANTNTDCGYLLTISTGGVITGATVPGADPYDGDDDALVGVINNSSVVYSGSITLTGTGNGGGIFGFDGDGICTYTNAAYCVNASTGYEGPLNTFANVSPDGSTGTVVITGLGIGATTFFSLEGSPSSIGSGITIGGSAPEPASVSMLAAGLLGLGAIAQRRSRSL